MQIEISSNIDKVLPMFAGLSDQFEFAVAKALTDTTKACAVSLSEQIDKHIDNPTPFTKKAFYSTRATKKNLFAKVGIKDIQAEYLKWQVYGGKRSPKGKVNKLPTKARLNKYGNISKGFISRYVAKSKEKTKGKNVSYFYGKPRGTSRPIGLYMRTRSKGLKSLVAFSESAFTNRKRFDFFGIVVPMAKALIDRKLIEAWIYAKQTAFRS